MKVKIDVYIRECTVQEAAQEAALIKSALKAIPEGTLSIHYSLQMEQSDLAVQKPTGPTP